MGSVSSRIPPLAKEATNKAVSINAGTPRDSSDNRICGQGQSRGGLHPKSNLSNASAEASESLFQREEHANSRDLDGRGCKTPQARSPRTPAASGVRFVGERSADGVGEPVEVVSPQRVSGRDRLSPLLCVDAEQNIGGVEGAVSAMEVEQYQSRHLEETNTDESGESRGPLTVQIPEGSVHTDGNTHSRSQRESKSGPHLPSVNNTLSSSGHAPEPMTVDEENQTQWSLEDEIPEGPNLSRFKQGGIPNVDVTRVVRLPPEFGSLQVRFRITAGDRSCALTPGSGTASDSGKVVGPGPPVDQGRHKNVEAADDPQSRLEQRLEMVDQFLSVLQRLENAHTQLGRLPSPCDLHALEVAQGEGSKSDRDDEVKSPRRVSTAGRRTEDSGHRSGEASRGSSMRHLSASSSGRLKQKILHASMSHQPQLQTDMAAPPRVQCDDCGPGGHKDPPQSVDAARGNLPRDAAPRTQAGLNSRTPMPGRLFTGTPQAPSSCLVLQIPPTSGAQIGVSSVPAIAPTYYTPQPSVSLPPACSPTSASPTHGHLAPARLPSMPHASKEATVGCRPPSDVTSPCPTTATLTGLCPGGEHRIQQRGYGMPPALELRTSQPMLSPLNVGDRAGSQRTSAATRCTEAEGNGAQCRVAGETGYAGFEFSDGRNTGEKNGFLEGEPHRAGRRGLETSQCRMDATTGTE